MSLDRELINNHNNFISLQIITDWNSQTLLLSENIVKINAFFLQTNISNLKFDNLCDLYDYFLEITNEGNFIKITSICHDNIFHYRKNNETNWNIFYPFEDVICFINENICICLPNNIVLSIHLIFNPLSNFFQGFPCFFENQINKIPSLEYPEDNSKEFFEDLELMNQQFSYLKQLQALKKPNLVKDFKKMVEKQNDKIEDNEDINDLAHKFVEDKLSQKNIRVDWVLKREINCQIVFEEQKELIKEECFIKKSKSKQKMVLRERKKMSFIHFFRNQKERHFSYDNTHMKRYKKVLEKNKNNDDEICVICLEKIYERFSKISCTHIFCFDCIKDWSKVTNFCPLCKKEFLEIQEFSDQSILINSIIVEPKKQTMEDDFFYDDNFFDNSDECCYICNRDNSPSLLMVCDKCNFFCCHTYCETPPLRQVPTEEWFCQTCREDTAESIFEESNDDSDTEIENKRYMTRGASSLLSSQQVSQTVSMSLRPRRNKNRNIFNNIDK